MKAREGEEGGILLIHPPVTKACEPPGGPARLAGALRRRGVPSRIWDANLEGQLTMMARAADRILAGPRERAAGSAFPPIGLILPPPTEAATLPATDEAGSRRWRGREGTACAEAGDQGSVWTRRAARQLDGNLAALRAAGLYGHPDRYRRAVADLNRLLATAARPAEVRLSLADYEDDRLSPLRSADLMAAAAAPETNPFHPWFSERLPAILAQDPPLAVGFSLNYLSQALTTFAMVGHLRRLHPSLKIILGGGLVTSWLRRPGWRNPFAFLVDDLIAGPGEGPLLARFGKGPDGGRDRPDLDGFPLDDYLAPGTVLPYSAAAGCWWRRCSFCPEVAEGNPYCPLPPERVTTDLAALTERYRPVLIHLLDNALSPALLTALAGRPPGAPWYGFARFTAELTDPDFCRRLREAGCVLLKLGLESGDQGVLDALGKGIDLATAARALKNLHAAGIGTYVYLLFGTPVETPAAARRTLDFVAAHAGAIDFLNLAIFNLPAWGPETEGLAAGEFYSGDLSLYRPFVHPRGWQRGEVRRFLEGEFKRHVAVAAILRRNPPFFTSNHAPFSVIQTNG